MVETSVRILKLLQTEPKLSARELAVRLDLTLRAIELQLAKLKADQKLRRIGPNKGGHWEIVE